MCDDDDGGGGDDDDVLSPLNLLSTVCQLVVKSACIHRISEWKEPLNH